MSTPQRKPLVGKPSVKRTWSARGQLPRRHRGQEAACNGGDAGLTPGSGRPPGEGSGPHSSILAWRIPRTEGPGGLQSTGSCVRQGWATAPQAGSRLSRRQEAQGYQRGGEGCPEPTAWFCCGLCFLLTEVNTSRRSMNYRLYFPSFSLIRRPCYLNGSALRWL